MANELFNVKDKVVVVTGGTGVLCKNISKYLAEQGAIIIALGRKEEVGNALVSDIKSQGGEAMFLKTDVMSREALEADRKHQHDNANF